MVYQASVIWLLCPKLREALFLCGDKSYIQIPAL